MGNAGARGYYRNAVAPEVTRKLALDVPALSPPERMAVLSDEWELARAGRHDIGTLLDLAAGFGKERTATVMQTLTRILGAAADATTASTRDAYRRWVSALLSPALADVGTTARPGDTDDTRALRATVVSAMGGLGHDAATLKAMRDRVGQELDKPGSVEPTLLNAAVRLAASEGDSALYDRYLARSQAAVNPEERYQFLYALTAFAKPDLVRRTMELVVSPEVRSQDAKLVISSMLGNPSTRDLAWTLVRERWTEIQQKTGEFVGNTVIVGALGSFCDAGKADEVQQFFTAHKVPDAERTLKQSVEAIRSCARFAGAQQPKLAQWLQAESR